MTGHFEAFTPAEQPDAPAGGSFAWPPLPWSGARFKWENRELEGSGKEFAKTLDNLLFQRAFTFIGAPDLKNYTLSADVMSEGNRRNMSNVGIINQRYVINLVGNWQQLEVVSNQDRIKVGVPFKWQANTWYRLTSRVDVAPDGSGVIRAKAWKRGEEEPAAWNIEVPHKHAHERGDADYVPELWDLPPCQNSRHERFFGLVRPDGSLKPHAKVIQEFAKTKPQVKPIPDYAKLTVNPDEFYKEPLGYLVDLYQQYLKGVENA